MAPSDASPIGFCLAGATSDGTGGGTVCMGLGIGTGSCWTAVRASDAALVCADVPIEDDMFLAAWLADPIAGTADAGRGKSRR